MIRYRGGTILWQASRARRTGLDLWNRTLINSACLQNESASNNTAFPVTSPSQASPPPPPPSTDMNQAKQEFSNVFMDAFEARNNDIGILSSDSNKTFDPSEGKVYDPVLNGEAPTADDMKLRIVRYLKEGGDISKLLETSDFESHDNLRERWSNLGSFCPLPHTGFTALDYLSPVEFNTVLKLGQWQVMRNELLDERYRLTMRSSCKMREYSWGKGDEKIVVSIPANTEYPGLSYKSYEDARSRVQSLLKLENAYVLEMWRLYRLTGIEKIKYYIVQTTPLIQTLFERFNIKETTSWRNLRRSFRKMVVATSEDAEVSKMELGPIGSSILFSTVKPGRPE